MSFPSPAEEYLEPNLDLNKLLVQSPTSTFFFRDASGDILVVDRALHASAKHMVIAILAGELVLKPYQELVKRKREFEVWGTVTYRIKAL